MTNNTARLLPAALTLALALPSAACLTKETRSTVYLEDDGAVTWTILETDVRSDSANPVEARQEEDGYLAEHQGGRPRLAAALEAIGGREISTRLLRPRAPFEAHVSARFDSVESLFMGYCAARQWVCSSNMERDGGKTTWTWTVVMEDGADDGGSNDRPIDALDEAVSNLGICLGTGRFLAATGFKLDGDRVAQINPEEDQDGQEQYTFSLTWEGRKQ